MEPAFYLCLAGAVALFWMSFVSVGRARRKDARIVELRDKLCGARNRGDDNFKLWQKSLERCDELRRELRNLKMEFSDKLREKDLLLEEFNRSRDSHRAAFSRALRVPPGVFELPELVDAASEFVNRACKLDRENRDLKAQLAAAGRESGLDVPCPVTARAAVCSRSAADILKAAVNCGAVLTDDDRRRILDELLGTKAELELTKIALSAEKVGHEAADQALQESAQKRVDLERKLAQERAFEEAPGAVRGSVKVPDLAEAARMAPGASDKANPAEVLKEACAAAGLDQRSFGLLPSVVRGLQMANSTLVDRALYAESQVGALSVRSMELDKLDIAARTYGWKSASDWIGSLVEARP